MEYKVAAAREHKPKISIENVLIRW